MVKRQIKLDKKRKLERKTNYNKRLILLKGNSLRLVVRKTNKQIIMQIIESKLAQDKILYSVNSKELLKHGWPKDKEGSLKSLAASYLTGLLLGKKAKELKQKIILDTGLIPSTKGSRIYAAVKGFADSGIEISFNEKIIPGDEMIKKDYDFFEGVKDKIGASIISQNKSEDKNSSNNKKEDDIKIENNGESK